MICNVHFIRIRIRNTSLNLRGKLWRYSCSDTEKALRRIYICIYRSNRGKKNVNHVHYIYNKLEIKIHIKCQYINTH